MSRWLLLLALSLLAPVAGATAPPEKDAEDTAAGPEAGGGATEDAAPESGFVSPERVSYLIGPSALLLRGGEGSISQRELLYTEVQQGLTDYLSVSVAGMVPLYAMGGESAKHAIFGFKAGGPVSERLSVAGGMTVFLLNDANIAFNYGAVTYGTAERNVTLTLSLPVDLRHGFIRNGDVTAMLMAGGIQPLARNLSLVGEVGWWSARQEVMGSVGVRVFGERWNLDAGVVRVPPLDLRVLRPLSRMGLMPRTPPPAWPWLSFSLHWG